MKILDIFNRKQCLHNPILPPYVIAEIGVNHNGDMGLAKGMIDQALQGGADAVKFQSYKANTLAIEDSPAYWDLEKESTPTQFELFKKYDQFNNTEYEALAKYCKIKGIDFLSTPFDEKAVDFLFPLMSCYKIASADITNIPLLRKVAKKGKPVLLSTGASNLAEIEMAVHEIEQAGCDSLALLHCVLNYPTPYPNANLGMLSGLQKAFPNVVMGYSDHTQPDANMLVLTTAYLKGAQIIEKHFTYDKTLPGNDHYHAMDMQDLQKFNRNVAFLQEIEGTLHKCPLDDEVISRQNARRSIVCNTTIEQGEYLTEDQLCCKRPGMGISPIHWDEIIGRKTMKKLEYDQVLKWSDLD